MTAAFDYFLGVPGSGGTLTPLSFKEAKEACNTFM